MRSASRMLTMAVLLGLAAGPALADEMVSLKVGYMQLKPEGEFAAFENGIGTEVDMDDLNFDDSEEVTAEAALQLGSFRLTAGYMPIKFSGDGALTNTIIFNGQPFTAGTQVKSDVDLDLYDVGFTYYLLNFDDLPVRLQLGPELSVKVVDGEMSMRSETFPTLDEEVSGTVPLPTIGARARVGLADFLAVSGRVGYVEYDDNSFLDADGQIELSPIPFVGLYGGYRYLDIDIDEDDIFVDARFSGPYGGVFVRF